MELGQALILVFTGVVALSTVVYAFLTWKLVSETQKLRRAQTEPSLSVFVELNEQTGNGQMDLVIQNEGPGPAEDILIGFKGDPTYFDDERPIDQLPAIKNGLRYLGSHQRFRIILGWLFGEDYERAIREPWAFDLKYKNSVGDSFSESFVVDFSQFAGLILTGSSPLVKIEKHLDTLQRDVHHAMTGFNHLHVITQTRDEYLERREEQRRERRSNSGVDNAKSQRELTAKLELLGIETNIADKAESQLEGDT